MNHAFDENPNDLTPYKHELDFLFRLARFGVRLYKRSSSDKLLNKAIKGALKNCIDDHGPIGLDNIGSANKRIQTNLAAALRAYLRSDGKE